MTLDPASEQRARSLLLSVVDGDATDADHAALNELLRGSADLRQSLVRFLCDGSFIADVIKTSDETVAFRRELASFIGESGQISMPDRTLPLDRDGQLAGKTKVGAKIRISSGLRAVNRHGLLIGAAASLLLALLGWQYLSVMSKLDRLHEIAARFDAPPQQGGDDPVRGTSARTTSGSARVTGVVDCEWPAGTTPLKFGDVLALGDRLQLKKGFVQLTFDMGAKVVVEGPSDFAVSSPNSATLDAGKIAAVVPQSGRGYTILTPTAEVVDLGTEFGVVVNDQGASEVHVFEGDVVARPRRGGQSNLELMHAREDQAIQFDAATDAGRRISADKRKFVRHLLPEPASETLPRLPVTSDLKLWLAADMMQGVKADAPVTTWPDILIGDNRFPDDAWQFDERRCPLWIRDANGLPAVQFDGWTTYLATSPMATGDEITAFVVFAPSDVSFASEFHGGMLLKFGPQTPSLEYSLMPDRRVQVRPWAKDDSGNPSYASAVLTNPVEPFKITASAYSYDLASNRAEVFLNGASQGATSATRPLKQLARKFIGAHIEPQWDAYFLGSIYEIIIYDAVLSESDRKLVFEYLSDRYGTPLNNQ